LTVKPDAQGSAWKAPGRFRKSRRGIVRIADTATIAGFNGASTAAEPVMRFLLFLAGALAVTPSVALDLPAESFTARSFVDWAAPQMAVKDITLTVYTPEEVSRRCLNYLSGAYSSPELTQEIVATGRSFTINQTQLDALIDCAGGEGYSFE